MVVGLGHFNSLSVMKWGSPLDLAQAALVNSAALVACAQVRKRLRRTVINSFSWGIMAPKLSPRTIPFSIFEPFSVAFVELDSDKENYPY